MAIMNKAGVFLYNLGLLLTLGIIFLLMKNYNIDEPSATLDYSVTMKTAIFIMLGIYYSFALGLTLASLLSRARKKGFLFSFLMIWFWALVIVSIFYAFFPYLLSGEYTEPGWRYFVMMSSVGIAFIPAFALMLYMFPGSVDRKYMINQLKKDIQMEQKKAKPFCPKCKFPSEKEWKHCPRCGAHFAD
ncbi:MAG: hypothetical protein ACMUIE_06570 [Thermoplasmatota archaeon]